jgi:hypothetical protein
MLAGVIASNRIERGDENPYPYAQPSSYTSSLVSHLPLIVYIRSHPPYVEADFRRNMVKLKKVKLFLPLSN